VRDWKLTDPEIQGLPFGEKNVRVEILLRARIRMLRRALPLLFGGIAVAVLTWAVSLWFLLGLIPIWALDHRWTNLNSILQQEAQRYIDAMTFDIQLQDAIMPDPVEHGDDDF